ncbi:MAG: cupin domain-containing protein [Dehalococcoidia bacterium]|nr:cupin domain-containing protein [Dehalococcoidia bacterium]
MKIADYSGVKANEEVSGVLMRVLIGAEEGAPNFVMRLFEVKSGCSTPFHTHNWEHEVFILSGQGKVKNEKEEETPITNGDFVFVAPNEKHCFINDGSDTLRFICLIPLVK